MDYNVTVETNGDIIISIGGIGAYGGSPVSFASLLNKPTTLAGYGITDAISGSPTFASITSKPTTLAGYGITDAAAATHTHTFASITSKPTTLAGYGITDAAAATHTHTFAGITSKPTTLLGYGITDAAAVNHTHSNATTSVTGFMSAADKTKLDGLAITAGTAAPNNADGQPNGAIYVKY